MDYLRVSGDDLAAVPIGTYVTFGGVAGKAIVCKDEFMEIETEKGTTYVRQPDAREHPLRVAADERAVDQNVNLIDGTVRGLERSGKLRLTNHLEFVADEEGFLFPSTISTEGYCDIRTRMTYLAKEGCIGTEAVTIPAERMADVPNFIHDLGVEVPADGSRDVSNATRNIKASVFAFNRMKSEEHYGSKKYPPKKSLLSSLFG